MSASIPPRVHLRSTCRGCNPLGSDESRPGDPADVRDVLARLIPLLRTDPVLAADTLARHHERLHTQLLRHPTDLRLRLSLGEIDVLLAPIFERWRRFRRDYSARVPGPKCEWCQRPLGSDALWTKGSKARPARGFCDAECLRASRVAEIWKRMQTAERVRLHRMRQRLFADLDRSSQHARRGERRPM